MLLEQTPELPLAHSESCRQRFHVRVIEAARFN